MEVNAAWVVFAFFAGSCFMSVTSVCYVYKLTVENKRLSDRLDADQKDDGE